MRDGLNDQQVGGANDGAKVPAALSIVWAIAVLFGGCALVAGYGGILLARDGTGLVAIGLGVVLLLFAFLAAVVAIGVPVQQHQLRRNLRRGGHR